jgi:hypothetical protein
MEPLQFDRIVRAFARLARRRAILGALVAVPLSAGFGVTRGQGVEPRETGRGDRDRGRDGRVAAARKKRKKKKRAPVCVPQCASRICGPDGCGSVCGECQAPAGCNSQGQCIGCTEAGQCPEIACRESTCVGGVCRYTDTANGSGCQSGRVCCDGNCVNTRSDGENCGSCGAVCATEQSCFAGRCENFCDVCPTGCDFDSLADAVAAAGTGGTIRICPGQYVGRFRIERDVTIVSVGSDALAVVLTDTDGPIVDIDNGVAVTIRNLTISGTTRGFVGGIRAFGTLRLEDVRVVDHVESGAGGRFGAGGVDCSDCALTLERCLIEGNTTSFSGAGLKISTASSVTITDSDIRNNRAEDRGGGINIERGAVTLTGCRIDGNIADDRGGGVYHSSDGPLVLNDTIVRNNVANDRNNLGEPGGGIKNINGIVMLNGSTEVSENTPDNCVDC